MLLHLPSNSVRGCRITQLWRHPTEVLLSSRCLQGIQSLETKGHRHGAPHCHQEVTNKNHCKGPGRQFVGCLLHKHEDPSSTPGAHTKSQVWCCASLQLQSWGGRDKRIPGDLAKLTLGSSERSCLKEQGGQCLNRDISGCSVAIHVSDTHIH